MCEHSRHLAVSKVEPLRGREAELGSRIIAPTKKQIAQVAAMKPADRPPRPSVARPPQPAPKQRPKPVVAKPVQEPVKPTTVAEVAKPATKATAAKPESKPVMSDEEYAARRARYFELTHGTTQGGKKPDKK